MDLPSSRLLLQMKKVNGLPTWSCTWTRRMEDFQSKQMSRFFCRWTGTSQSTLFLTRKISRLAFSRPYRVLLRILKWLLPTKRTTASSKKSTSQWFPRKMCSLSSRAASALRSSMRKAKIIRCYCWQQHCHQPSRQRKDKPLLIPRLLRTWS